MKEPTFSPRSDPTAPGFTLIELLVVIAIIAILAGMLLSAVGQLAHKAQAIGCLGNYRQLQLAWGMYTDDFAGHLPRNEAQARGSYPGSALIPGAKVAPDLGLWNCDAAANRYDSSLGSWVLGNTCWDPDDTGIKQGTLWPYVGSGERIYRCPADRSMVQGQPQLPRRRSVSMSSYMNSYPGNENRHYFWAWHKFHDITQPAPSDAVVFVDEHQNSINDGYFQIGHTNHPGGYVAWAWYDAPALRHGTACTVSFADGHAAVWHMVEPTTGKIATQGRFGSDRDLLRFYRAIPWKLPIRP